MAGCGSFCEIMWGKPAQTAAHGGLLVSIIMEMRKNVKGERAEWNSGAFLSQPPDDLQPEEDRGAPVCSQYVHLHQQYQCRHKSMFCGHQVYR